LRSNLQGNRFFDTVKQGSNKFERSDADFVHGASDSISSDAYLHLLDSALRTAGDGLIYEPRVMPRRLLLPRGTKSGLGLRLFISLNPLDQTQPNTWDDSFAYMPLDGRAMDFPLDRPLVNVMTFRNIMIKNVHVYHVDDTSDAD
jgi:hypothetical protein